jgi:hypothetical protein
MPFEGTIHFAYTWDTAICTPSIERSWGSLSYQRHHVNCAACISVMPSGTTALSVVIAEWGY